MVFCQLSFNFQCEWKLLTWLKLILLCKVVKETDITGRRNALKFRCYVIESLA